MKPPPSQLKTKICACGEANATCQNHDASGWQFQQWVITVAS